MIHCYFVSRKSNRKHVSQKSFWGAWAAPSHKTRQSPHKDPRNDCCTKKRKNLTAELAVCLNLRNSGGYHRRLGGAWTPLRGKAQRPQI